MIQGQRPAHEPQSEFDWNLARFAQGSSSMNYTLPVSILKELFEELFLKALGIWRPEPKRALPASSGGHAIERPKIPEIGRLFAEAYLGAMPPDEARRVEAQLVELLVALAHVPTRHRVFLDSDTYFSERDLLRIHSQCTEILGLMGLKETYERRTRSDI